MKSLWEILVPTIINGKPVRRRYHRVWDKKIHEISGGLTILNPAKGAWINPNGELFEERMIPVRIMCDYEQIEIIADFTAKYYSQQAIMFYRISDLVVIKHYS